MTRFTDSHSNRYSGVVYDNHSGKPMASVAVSNGREVVLTDEKGGYSLAGWCKTKFITVTVPSGYWSNAFYLPVSGKKTGYDFHLDRLETDLTNHTFLHVTDSEVGADGADGWVEKLREIAGEVHPAFIIHTGDICYIDGLKAHIHDMNDDNMKVPVRYVIGNHDYVNWGEYGEALFEHIYGPVMYSFDVGAIHYIITPIVYGDVKAKYTKSDVLAFVQNDLKYVSSDKKVIMFNHNYCESNEIEFVLSDGLTETDLKKNRLLAWVFGHWHYNYLNEIHGIFNITTSKPDSGGIDASPATIRSVVLEGGTLAASHCYYNDFRKTVPAGSCKWTVSLGGHILYSAPASRDGVVYVGTIDDGWPKNCLVAAIREETGQVLWKYRTKNSVKSDIRILRDQIIVQDTEGNVCCLDLSGKEIWTARVDLLGPNHSSNRIAVDEKYIYCGGQQHTYCLNASDGSQVWNRKLSEGNTSPTGFVRYENMLLIGAQWDKLYALDAATGEVLWSNNSDLLHNFVMTAAVNNDCLFVTSRNRLYKIHIPSGNTIAYREIEGYLFDSATTPYIEDGVMYMGTTNRGIVAVDTQRLEILWTFATGKNLIDTSPYSKGNIATVDSAIVPFGGNLCFGASDGCLYIVDKNGKEIAKYDTGSPINQAPVAESKFVIVADFSGNVTRYDMM